MTATGRDAVPDRLAAFESVVSEYETALLRYAGRLLRDAAAAEDIVQETFLRLYRAWKDPLAPGPQVATWLYRVAHNCAVDHLRRETRRGILHLHHAKPDEDFVPPDRGKAFRVGEDAERAAGALSVLSVRERQLVILKVYEEKSYKDIGEITGLSVGNVGFILHHAMKKMAAELKKAKAI